MGKAGENLGMTSVQEVQGVRLDKRNERSRKKGERQEKQGSHTLKCKCVFHLSPTGSNKAL